MIHISRHPIRPLFFLPLPPPLPTPTSVFILVSPSVSPKALSFSVSPFPNHFLFPHLLGPSS